MEPRLEGPKGLHGMNSRALSAEYYSLSTDFRESVPEFEDSTDLRGYLDVVLRRKWLVLAILTVVVSVTLVVNLRETPMYRAVARLQISPNIPKLTKFEDFQSLQLMYPADFIQTQVKLFQSGTLAQRVLDRLSIGKRPDPASTATVTPDRAGRFQAARQWLREWASTVKGWVSPGKETQIAAGPAMEELAVRKGLQGWLLGSLEVYPERDTTLVNLAFSSPDPAQARDVLNTLIEEFTSWQMDKRIDAAAIAKEQLEKQLELARIKLEQAERSLNNFAQRAGIVSLNSNLNLIFRQLEELNNALALVQSEKIAKESLYIQAKQQGVDSLPAVVENATMQGLRAEYIKLRGEYEEAHVTFKEKFPSLKSMQARMGDTAKKIKEEEKRLLRSIESDFLITSNKEKSLRDQADKLTVLALGLNDKATQYKILEREVETSKVIHQSLLERSKEIDANVGTELGNIQVVDHATLPLAPYKPNVGKNLMMALAFGLMGGVALAFLLEFLDNTVKRVDELSDRFHIPLLGVLPVAGADEVKDLDHLVRVKPRALFSESIRTAKVSIQLSSAGGHPPRTLLITSTGAGEGKSTIACNLAQSFAGGEDMVVLVDADLRNPRLHHVFGTNGFQEKPRGLSQFLSGQCGDEDILRKTDIPNLFFISAGPIPPNPAELLASSRMRGLLDRLAERFHLVVIDAPPSAGLSDVLVLGHCVDGVVLVSTLGRTVRGALRIFRRSMFHVGGNLLGTVVNKMDGSHYYGSYYYNYYRTNDTHTRNGNGARLSMEGSRSPGGTEALEAPEAQEGPQAVEPVEGSGWRT